MFMIGISGNGKVSEDGGRSVLSRFVDFMAEKLVLVGKIHSISVRHWMFNSE
ncbi:uncharacterized protein ASCRUDRAFT_75070 [Ascoidea rubescens DSM 1968]|uniref:Uncharacterized protein n=1 Tax=Ascoidea rubescens DSM 1968 TaxID=1344418 RepID=A0A1D2VJK5_9ASCO|nr:hypothetical protein ASCRUDRAFT_75070 [Ascoidea rubescens DSM 1968]ODV61791.1 hypothetical protein ASCRUDRAFT_75070 [Ascoidea rubescens DSM 1968]